MDSDFANLDEKISSLAYLLHQQAGVVLANVGTLTFQSMTDNSKEIVLDILDKATDELDNIVKILEEDETEEDEETG